VGVDVASTEAGAGASRVTQQFFSERGILTNDTITIAARTTALLRVVIVARSPPAAGQIVKQGCDVRTEALA